MARATRLDICGIRLLDMDGANPAVIETKSGVQFMSKNKIIATGLAASMLLSTAAFAASQSKVGEVKSIDATKNELVLTGGETFQLPATFKADAVKSGQKVKITYEMKDGKMAATQVNPVK